MTARVPSVYPIDIPGTPYRAEPRFDTAFSRAHRRRLAWPVVLVGYLMWGLTAGALSADAQQPDPAELPDIGLAVDPAPAEVTGEFREGSHVKLFLPNLPYLAISHAINASLVRPSRNAEGWEYDLAISHKSVEDRVWEFELRRGVRFQDGSLCCWPPGPPGAAAGSDPRRSRRGSGRT